MPIVTAPEALACSWGAYHPLTVWAAVHKDLIGTLGQQTIPNVASERLRTFAECSLDRWITDQRVSSLDETSYRRMTNGLLLLSEDCQTDSAFNLGH